MGGGVNPKGLVPMIYENLEGTLHCVCVSGIIIDDRFCDINGTS